jgi:hypothetical protein
MQGIYRIVGEECLLSVDRRLCPVISHRVVNVSHMAIVCKSLAVLTLVRRWKQDGNHSETHYLYIRTVGGRS